MKVFRETRHTATKCGWISAFLCYMRRAELCACFAMKRLCNVALVLSLSCALQAAPDSTSVSSSSSSTGSVVSGEAAKLLIGTDVKRPWTNRDTTATLIRQPSAEQWREALSRNDYSYDRQRTQPRWSLMDSILRWLEGRLPRVEGVEMNGTFEVLKYLLPIVFLFIVVWLLGKGNLRLSLRRSAPQLESMDVEEVLAATPDDLRARCTEAEQDKDYRRATRYQFLIALREVVDRGMVHYDPSKTNRQYMRELRLQPFHTEFSALAGTFEAVWYGEHGIELQDYQEIVQRTKRISTAISEAQPQRAANDTLTSTSETSVPEEVSQ